MRVSPLFLVVTLAACGGRQPVSGPEPQAAAPTPVAAPAPPPATVRDPELEREVSRLRAQAQDRNAQIAELERRLSEAINEVVRAMARLRTLATRAEAASAMAEAEVTVQQLRQRAGARAAEVQEADRMLRTAGVEFEAQNYGGAVYLATQAKRLATSVRGRR